MLAAGSTIGSYKIVSPLGTGGMGEVYRATDLRLKRQVALKVLPEAFAKQPERLARIAREAEVLASLNHKNIATIYGTEDAALVMEFVDGEPPEGPMPFDQAWGIAAQIADALQYAHDRGIVHRDLKPANVKVTADGVVKLLDFGLAKAFREESVQLPDQEHSPTLTIAATGVGVILGTAAYMAPEQAKGKEVDKRADIWAFGVVLYEMLTGERLFKGEDVSDTLAQVLTKEPDLSRVPPRARKLLRRCLEKDPKKRLRDIGEAEYYIEEPNAAQQARKQRLAWAIGVVAAVAAFGSWYTRPGRSDAVTRSFILPPETFSFRCEGDEGGPAVLSPNGRRLAFAATKTNGTTMLWIQALDSETAQPIAGTDGAMFPFWSPDSRSVGFFADGRLKTVDATGGTIRILAEAPAPRGGSWNQKGLIAYAPTLTSPIMRVPASGGSSEGVTNLDGQKEISHRWPSFLPDGKHLLYTSRARGIFVASLERGEPAQRLLDENSMALNSSGFLLYTRGNTLFARPFDPTRRQFTGEVTTVVQSLQVEPNSNRACISASENGSIAYHPGLGKSQLTWVDRRGGRVGVLGTPGAFRGVEIAPDGKRVAGILNEEGNRASIWIYDVARDVKRRFLSMDSYNMHVAWSPDSSRIAVGAHRAEGFDIYAKEVDGTGREELLFRSPSEALFGYWIPKGGVTLMLRNPQTGFDLYYAAKDQAAVPILRSSAGEMEGLVSPDRRWILFSSDESASGVFQIYVAEFPSGAHRRQVSTSWTNTVRWNWKTKEIFYASHDKVLAAPMRVNGDSLDVGTPHQLFELKVDCVSSDDNCFDVAPDGQQFLVIEPVGPRPPVALVQNWTATLKN